jgi:multisubunit Na+/H+ antiporter MnhF subunit
MDLTNPKTFKLTYTAVSAVIALCAIAMAIIHQYDIGMVLIILGCLVIFIGAMIFSKMMQIQKMEDLKKF